MKNDLQIFPGVWATTILIRTITLFVPARARTMFGPLGLGRSLLATRSRSLLAGQAVRSTSLSRVSDIRRVPQSPLTTTRWYSHGMILASLRCLTSSPTAIWAFLVCSNSALALCFLLLLLLFLSSTLLRRFFPLLHDPVVEGRTAKFASTPAAKRGSGGPGMCRSPPMHIAPALSSYLGPVPPAAEASRAIPGGRMQDTRGECLSGWMHAVGWSAAGGSFPSVGTDEGCGAGGAALGTAGHAHGVGRGWSGVGLERGMEGGRARAVGLGR